MAHRPDLAISVSNYSRRYSTTPCANVLLDEVVLNFFKSPALWAGLFTLTTEGDFTNLVALSLANLPPNVTAQLSSPTISAQQTFFFDTDSDEVHTGQHRAVHADRHHELRDRSQDRKPSPQH